MTNIFLNKICVRVELRWVLLFTLVAITFTVIIPQKVLATSGAGSTQIQLEVGVQIDPSSNQRDTHSGGPSAYGSSATVSAVAPVTPIKNERVRETDFINNFIARARTGSSDIFLTWDSSSVAGTSYYVRLVRSPFFYPIDTLDGKVVFEGRGTSVRDIDIVQGQTYFYTLFLLNEKNTMLSSAIATVQYPIFSNSVKKPARSISIGTTRYDPLIVDKKPFILGDNSIDDTGLCVGEKGYTGLAQYTNSFRKSESSRLEVSQGKTQNRLAGGAYTISKDKPVYIRIPADSLQNFVSGNNTRIALCVVGDTPDIKKGYPFSFNSEGNFYEVTLPPFLRIKDYQFYVGMLKYKGVESILAAHRFSVKDSERIDTNLSNTAGKGKTELGTQGLPDSSFSIVPFLQKIRDTGFIYWINVKASAYEVVNKFLNIFN